MSANKVRGFSGSLALRPMPLRIAYGDAWITAFGTVRFTREKGKVTGFALTGGRVRNVAFTREPGR
jgi:hypothetical protein